MNKLPSYLTSVTKLCLLLLILTLIALQFVRGDADTFQLFATVVSLVAGYYFGKTTPEGPSNGA
jgi:hypothetical protein